MHPHHQGLLVVTAVENADVAPIGQHFHAPPQIIVVQLLRRGRLEREYLAALRVDPGHDVLDGAVLARSVHRLEDEQQSPLVLRIEFVL